MDRDAEKKVDQALAALAREVNDASPRPNADLIDKVVANAAADRTLVSEADVDLAVLTLASEVAAASPRPGPDLVARVLADAAAAAPVQATADLVERPEPRAAAKPSAWSWALGWTSGAALAMVVALVVGIGVGMQLDPADMDLLGDQDDMSISMADGGLMLEDVL